MLQFLVQPCYEPHSRVWYISQKVEKDTFQILPKTALPLKIPIQYSNQRYVSAHPIEVLQGANDIALNEFINWQESVTAASIGHYNNGNGQNSAVRNRLMNMVSMNTPTRLTFTKYPLLITVPMSQREALLRAKLQQCCVLFDFDETAEYLEEKEAKRLTLNEIHTFVQENPKQIPTTVYPDMFELLKSNCFRALKSHPHTYQDEEEEPNLEPSWPHIQVVYQIFTSLLESDDFQPSEAKKYTDFAFIMHLLDLFDSEDPRERECLKTLLHRIYGQIISTRAGIRKAMMHLFMRFIYETGRHNGVAELLEILGSIINGFQVPLKNEHIVFLVKVLLPLHKPSSLPHYHPQLSYCVLEYVRKDVSLFRTVLQKGILKFWPKNGCVKEVMLLNELEELIDIADDTNLNPYSKEIFTHLALCVNSPHFHVAEKTLLFWSNVRFLAFVRNNFAVVLNIIFPSLYRSREHWNKNIQTLAFNALKVLMDMDQVYFNKFTEGYREKRRKEKELIRERQKKWNLITERAYKNPLSSSILSLPPEKLGGSTKSPRISKKVSRHSMTSTGSAEMPSLKNESGGASTVTSSSRNPKKSAYAPRDRSFPRRNK